MSNYIPDLFDVIIYAFRSRSKYRVSNDVRGRNITVIWLQSKHN